MTYVVWRQSVVADTYSVIGTQQAPNVYGAVEALIAGMRVDVGDRVFLVGQLSADEPFGGAHYEIEATGAVPRPL
jgi:hypothetical protein